MQSEKQKERHSLHRINVPSDFDVKKSRKKFTRGAVSVVSGQISEDYFFLRSKI
jgi:hypothetical protein